MAWNWTHYDSISNPKNIAIGAPITVHVDAGICLTAHYDDPDFESGTRGDTLFTLESLPPVIREANGDGVLVVFRHAE